VGLNLIRKDLGLDLARRVTATCQQSLLWALDHADEVYGYASRFGRGLAREHVEMFSSSDTLRLPDDARRAAQLLFERVAARGLGPRIDSFQIIEGLPEDALRSATRC
jgi:predicted solute-binding protein